MATYLKFNEHIQWQMYRSPWNIDVSTLIYRGECLYVTYVNIGLPYIWFQIRDFRIDMLNHQFKEEEVYR